MKLKPLADRVVLKQNKAEERTASGIFLTSSAQEKRSSRSAPAAWSKATRSR